MPTFDRTDICAAYAALEMDYNVGGVLCERPSCSRRRESVGVQLDRIGFVTGMAFSGYRSLEENGKEIYDAAVERLGLPSNQLPSISHGYPVVYVVESEVYCAACATHRGLSEEQGYAHWEGEPLTCEDCETELESAYGPCEGNA